MHTDISVKKPTSIIFLDIDGVLMPARSQRLNNKISNKVEELFTKKEGLICGFTALEWKMAASHFFDGEALGNLEKLILKISRVANIAIVISSMWREDSTVTDLRDEMFLNYPFSSLIIGKTPDEKEWILESRAKQIEFWLKENREKYNVQNFVIFDDTDDELSACFPSNFVKVKYLLKQEDIEKGSKILNL